MCAWKRRSIKRSSSPQTSDGAPGWHRPPRELERCSTLPRPGSATCTCKGKHKGKTDSVFITDEPLHSFLFNLLIFHAFFPLSSHTGISLRVSTHQKQMIFSVSMPVPCQQCQLDFISQYTHPLDAKNATTHTNAHALQLFPRLLPTSLHIVIYIVIAPALTDGRSGLVQVKSQQVC